MNTAAPPLPHPHPRGTIRAALAYPKFRLLFIGAALSNVGTWMQNFILPTYIDDRTHSAALVGALYFAQLGPMLFLSIPAGALADRVDRTRLVQITQGVMLSVSVVLGLLVWQHAPVWSLFLAQLTLGTASAIQAPAFAASLPMMVDRADLPGAVSLNSAQTNGSRIVGPSIAALFAALGISLPWLLLINSAAYLFLMVQLMSIPLPRPAFDSTPRGWRALGLGMRTARSRRVVSRSIVMMCLFSLVCLPFIGLLPSIARMNWDIASTSGTYKALYVVWGLGAFAGAVGVGTWLAHLDKRGLVRTGLLAFALFLTAFAIVPTIAWAFPTAVLLGFAYFTLVTALSSVLQENLFDAERATVMPLWFMAFGGTVPIGNLIGGPLIDRFGPRPVLLAGAVFAVVLAVVFDLRRLNDDDLLVDVDTAAIPG